ncbi:MAG: CRISPR-associated endonuclease Cas1 [Candidatus Nezhaarchaeota archaeon]|nr:CRISPR-associated endonuclease Cas1 [Candidatus Nezhaarchaeota archaeon]
MTSKVALVDKWGAYLGVKEGRFQLRVREGGQEKVAWDLAPVELDSIVFVVPGASISASAIELAANFGIDIAFFNRGRPVARLLQATYGSTLETWLKQAECAADSSRRLLLTRLFVEGKVYNQRQVLMEYVRRLRAAGKSISALNEAVSELDRARSLLTGADSAERVVNIESHAARHYWNAVSTLLPQSLGFKHRMPRSRVPPGARPDAFNLALNIGYSALKNEVWRAVFMANLNPYIGFLHKQRSGRMALVYDLMEEFRPIVVDRPLITLARQRAEVVKKLEDRDREAVREVWRAVVGQLYNGSEPYRSIIVEQARLLARHIRGTDTYKPFRSRW